MPFELELSWTNELTLTSAIINGTITVNLVPFHTRNNLTFYRGYCEHPLPQSVRIEFLPIFDGCRLYVYFSMTDDINYYHTYHQRLTGNINGPLPDSENTIFYSCRNSLQLVNGGSINLFVKYSPVDSFTSILDYRLGKLK